MPQSAHIWLIDDDDSTLEIVARAFKKEQLDCQLRLFTDADALLTEIKQTETLPTLLITDYTMPRMNGLELIKWLKANSSTRYLRTVLFSRQITSSIMEQAEHLDIYQIENKPTEFSEWRELAKELCSAGLIP